MNTDAPPTCHLCSLPILRKLEVFLSKNTFHPGCAVTAAKEKKHEINAADARRRDKGDEGGSLAPADAA